MTNSLLNATAVTREALRVLHQKLAFVGTINRTYDDRYAKSGAKIGNDLKIRTPQQYTVRTGASLSTQDTLEHSVTMSVASQAGIDLSFTSEELTMHIDDFSSRILEPAMAQLAAHIENDALSMYKDVAQLVDGDGASITMAMVLEGRKNLSDSLAPTNKRFVQMNTQHSLDLVDALKGLFHDSKAIEKQYREGIMGRTGGFDFYENTLLANHTTGTAAEGDTGWNVNGASQGTTAGWVETTTLTINTGTTTLLKGDVITIAGCNRVHPESKVSSGELMKFVVTADIATNATTVTVSPGIISAGQYQNVSAAPTNGGAISKIGAGASETLVQSLAYQQDAFAFATADLLMPDGVDFKAREVYDGISMRLVRQYAISTDTFPCRFDVLYGYKTIRPQLACRIHADG